MNTRFSDIMNNEREPTESEDSMNFKAIITILMTCLIAGIGSTAEGRNVREKTPRQIEEDSYRLIADSAERMNQSGYSAQSALDTLEQAIEEREARQQSLRQRVVFLQREMHIMRQRHAHDADVRKVVEDEYGQRIAATQAEIEVVTKRLTELREDAELQRVRASAQNIREDLTTPGPDLDWDKEYQEMSISRYREARDLVPASHSLIRNAP